MAVKKTKTAQKKRSEKAQGQSREAGSVQRISQGFER